MNKENFIGTFYIDKKICNNLINYYNKNKYLLEKINCAKTQKKSTDLGINPNTNQIEVTDYLKELNICLIKYKNKYKVLNSHLPSWGITENINIQKYEKNEGFLNWHCEYSITDLRASKRMLVFMTYLNDVEINGETEWKYQKIKFKPKTGLTVIWPPYWTHLHRGITSNKEKKFIITGWYSFI